MPIVDDQKVATRGVVILGTGDVALAPATDSEDPRGPNRWLIFSHAEAPGPIGVATEVGRGEEFERVFGAEGEAARLPVGVALYFGNAAAVDQVIAALAKIRADLATAAGVTDGTPE